MTCIIIRERDSSTDSANASISFDQSTEYPIRITDPFSKGKEARLEWYFEQHLRFPFTRQEEARNVAHSITLYGETLFRQILENPDVAAKYRGIIQAGTANLQIEIQGASNFHRLHWEALKDPDMPRPFALDVPFIRRHTTPQPIRQGVIPSPTINVLIVTARPYPNDKRVYRTVARPLVEGIHQTNLPVQIDILRPGTYHALVEHLEQTRTWYGHSYYHVVHFDVHGGLLTYEQLIAGEESQRYHIHARPGREDIDEYVGLKAFLFLESTSEGQADPVETSELATTILSHHIPIVVLNACQSGRQVGASETAVGSFLIQHGIQVVIAMDYTISVSTAERLMHFLYDQFYQGRDIATAMLTARQDLFTNKPRRGYFNQMIALEDWVLPVMYQNHMQRLDIRSFTPDERENFFNRRQHSFAFPQTAHGFIGRELDTHQIERQLTHRHNILLLRGMGGTGKTTLLRYLGAWWQTTGLVDQVFYFGYDEHPWSYQEIMDSIASHVLGKSDYYERVFQHLSLNARHAMLIRRLRSQRHLLILDNTESITGARLAIRHTLTRRQQADIRRFLADLEGGKTFVLLGSRRYEGWLTMSALSESPRNDDASANDRKPDLESVVAPDARISHLPTYHLTGLDTEAASLLTDAILKQHHIAYEEHQPFYESVQKLLKLLDGHPLALHVVLPNLAHQTPAELLEILDFDTTHFSHLSHLHDEEGNDKNLSLLRCIEYLYSNISSEAQELLCCLAPFTMADNQNLQESYIEHLKQQPALKHLSFDHWHEIIHEATRRGLLRLHADMPDFLRLHPVLPYFLYHRLRGKEAQLQAIHTAFLNLYETFSSRIVQFLHSNVEEEKHIGETLVQLEYENIITALNLALQSRESIGDLYFSISNYLDTIHDERRALELGELILEYLETYPPEQMHGTLGAEFVSILDDIARRQFSFQEYTKAEHSYQRTLQLIEGLEYHDKDQPGKMTASAYEQLGRVAHEQNLWHQATVYYQQALAIFRKLDDKYEQARIHHNLGLIAQGQKNWEQAEHAHQQALRIFTEFNHRSDQAHTYQQLGKIALERRRWHQAEFCYQRALAIFLQLNERTPQATIYTQLGIVARAQRHWKKAKDYYQQALQIYQALANQHEQAQVYYELGMVAQAQRHWEQSVSYYQQALHLFEHLEEWYCRGNTYQQLGRVAQQQHHWEQAETYYEQAFQIFTDLKEYYEQASIYEQLGRMAQQQALWPQAEVYATKALQIYIDANDLHRQGNMYGQLGIIARAQHQWSQARDYFLRALKSFVAQGDTHSASITLGDLAWHWSEHNDETLPPSIASILGASVEEVEERLRKSKANIQP